MSTVQVVELNICKKYYYRGATCKFMLMLVLFLWLLFMSSRSFSQVVADGQFVALGLVLLGLLARISALVALPETPEHDGKRGRGMGAEAVMEVEDIGDAEDLGRPVLRPTASLGASNLGRAEGREKQDDLAGVDEDRDSISGTAITGFQPHRAGTTSTSRQKAVKKKKGATGRNAIDNLFNGIG